MWKKKLLLIIVILTFVFSQKTIKVNEINKNINYSNKVKLSDNKPMNEQKKVKLIQKILKDPETQKLVQSKKFRGDDKEHWAMVEKAIEEFQKGKNTNNTAYESLLEIEKKHSHQREIYLQELKTTELGQKALKLAQVAGEIRPQNAEWNKEKSSQEKSSFFSMLETKTKTRTRQEEEPSKWPCTCTPLKCFCEDICEVCEEKIDPNKKTEEQYLQQESVSVWETNNSSDSFSSTSSNTDDSNVPIEIDAEADSDSLIEINTILKKEDSDNKNNVENTIIKTNVVTKRSIGTAPTPELAALLQMSSIDGGDEDDDAKIRCEGCSKTCNCFTNCTCELPAPNKDHCQLAHALLLQCEITCLPLFPWDLICYAFTNCAKKCKVDGADSIPQGLVKICQMVCGCKKFCIEG